MYMAYQPVVNFPSCEIVGYEALARFEGGQTPDEMFDAAWRDGNGVDMETEAIKMAIQGFPHNINKSYLAINASAKTIVAMRGELVKDPGLEIPWPNLVIEISEKDKVEDYQLLSESLRLLRQRQVRLAIDDYGAGYSNYALLAQINPDFIKIDRAVVQHLNENHQKQSVIGAILSYARNERSTVIAEGIETEEEMKWCIGLGVDSGQGYLFGKPEPFDETSAKQSSTTAL